MHKSCRVSSASRELGVISPEAFSACLCDGLVEGAPNVGKVRSLVTQNGAHGKQVVSGRHLVVSGRHLVVSGRHLVVSGRHLVVSGRHLVVTWSPFGRHLVVSGRQWSPLGRQWSPLGRQWSPLGREWPSLGRPWSPLGRRGISADFLQISGDPLKNSGYFPGTRTVSRAGLQNRQRGQNEFCPGPSRAERITLGANKISSARLGPGENSFCPRGRF